VSSVPVGTRWNDGSAAVRSTGSRIAAAAAAAAIVALPLLYAGMYAGDAAIHLVFAENAAAGKPFEFNPGERVPGVTSPGYMFLLAAMFRWIGAAAMPQAVKLVDVAAWYVVVWLTWRVGARLGLAFRWRLAGVLTVGTMPGSVYNATIGMENGMFALPVLAVALLAARRRLLGPAAPTAPVADLLVGATIGAGFWLRPEAALVGAVWFPWRLASAWASRRGVVAVVVAALLALTLALSELSLHHAYTGVWLPGSAQARVILGGMEGVSLGPLVVNGKFALRLLAYAPLTLLAACAALFLWRWRGRRPAPEAEARETNALGPCRDPASRRVLAWLLALSTLAFIAYSTVLGALHLARYTIFVWPGIGLTAAAGGQALWATWPPRLRRWRMPLFGGLAAALIVVYGVEAWTRRSLGRHDEVINLARAPALRRAFSDALLERLGEPVTRRVSVAYQEVQLRYWLDDRFVVRSLDGRTDPLLLQFVRDGWIDHLGYIRARGIDALMELPDYNTTPGHWSPAELRDLPIGSHVVRDALRFERLADDVVRVTPAPPPA
jgi:hypothetical protein